MWNQIVDSLQQSMARVTDWIARLLPGLLAFVVALIVFIGLAWLLAAVVRRVLTAVRFDERVMRERAGIAEWSPRSAPAVVVTRLVFWATVIVGVLIGVSAFEAATAQYGISAYIFSYVPRLVGAILLLFAGNIVARFLSRSVLISAVNMNLQYARLLGAGVKWLVMVLTAAMVLDHLAIGRQIVDLAFGILFGGIVLALSLAVGLGSRDLVSRSLEREAARPADAPAVEERLQHF